MQASCLHRLGDCSNMVISLHSKIAQYRNIRDNRDDLIRTRVRDHEHEIEQLKIENKQLENKLKIQNKLVKIESDRADLNMEAVKVLALKQIELISLKKVTFAEGISSSLRFACKLEESEGKIIRTTAFLLNEIRSMTVNRVANTPLGRPLEKAKKKRRASIAAEIKSGVATAVDATLTSVNITTDEKVEKLEKVDELSVINVNASVGARVVSKYSALLSVYLRLALGLGVENTKDFEELKDCNTELDEAEGMTAEDIHSNQQRVILNEEIKAKADLEAAEAEVIAAAAAAAEAAAVLAAKLERSKQLRKLVAKPNSAASTRGRSATKKNGKAEASSSPAKGGKGSKGGRGTSKDSNKSPDKRGGRSASRESSSAKVKPSSSTAKIRPPSAAKPQTAPSPAGAKQSSRSPSPSKAQAKQDKTAEKATKTTEKETGKNVQKSANSPDRKADKRGDINPDKRSPSPPKRVKAK